MEPSEIIESWKMYRARFFNFWYYPDQEYAFENGCAVLRGHNGSGKSVTTQLLITVLLDGDTRSHKLDPFGGKERSLKATLLGEEGLLKIDERIGYITMEFKKGDSEVYKTIGIGVEAKREKVSPKVWFFILEGKRIGEQPDDLKLYKEGKIDGEMKKLPLDEKDFRQLVEVQHQCGKVYSRREEYAERVNKHLFGFDSLESYKGLMDLLIQIRSPKLSDQNRPEGVVEVLNESLPQLTHEELRPLTTSIEAIDRIEKDLETYKKDLKAIKSLNNVYDEYNQISLVEKAAEYVKAQQHQEKVKKEILDSEKLLIKMKERMSEIHKGKTKLENQLEVYREEKTALGFEEIESLSQKKSTAEDKVKQLEQKIKSTEMKLKKAQDVQREYARKQDEYTLQLDRAKRELEEFLSEMKDTAEILHYGEHKRFLQHFEARKEDEQYSFAAWKESLKKHEKFIAETKQKLENHDKMNTHLLHIENTLGELQQKMDASNSLIDQLQNDCDQEYMSIVENIQRWADESEMLDVRSDTISALNRGLLDVFIKLEKESFLQPLAVWFGERKEQFQKQLLEQSHRIEQMNSSMERIIQEIEEWKSSKEVEPFFVKGKRNDWKQLKQRNIPFLPFYEAFEFVDGIEEEQQLTIQNALFEAGLLSSVVVPQEHVKEAMQFTSVVEYAPSRGKNLTEVLRASDQFEYEYILAGIPFEQNERAYILASGTFNNGFVEGQASPIIDTVYIGKAAREAYRARKIAELEAEYMSLLSEKNEAERNKTQTDEKLQQLKVEYAGFPSLDSLKTIIGKMEKEEQRKQEIFEPERVRTAEEIEKVSLEMKELMNEVKRSMEWVELELSSSAFGKEARCIQDYAECLSDIEKTFIEKANAFRNAQNYKQQYEQQESFIEDYQVDIHEDERDKDRAEREIAGYERTLIELGSEDIIERMRELTSQINEILPKQISALEKENTLLEVDDRSEKEKIYHNQQNELPFRHAVHEAWEKAFAEHHRFGFIDLQEEVHSNIEKAQLMVTKFADLIDKKRENIERVKNRLNKRYNEQNMELFHYDMELNPKPSEHIPDMETEDETKAALLRLMSEQMHRIIITMDVGGERVPPSFAVEQLERRIADLEVEANERDRELYETILVNTLGETIRQKIHYVQRWENEMNKFMEHENLIKFRLKWVPKKSEKEEELHTKQLVDALKRDSQWIDLTEISSHFRSKIKEAKRKHDNQPETTFNLQQIMKEVLDYRKWFDFEIYFTKKGDTEKRMTRKTYGELSGGQRVLAMITPVLAALYAKYSEAKEDCPRIFTLDEAFSRVDDDNVNVMFAYIYKLNFNYILNSQSLWGCFESVPSLDIYELVRADNRPSVSVASYYWNGIRKVRKEKPEMDESETGEPVYDLVN